jgi:hypothetical protein
VFAGIPVAAQPGGRALSWALKVSVAAGAAAIVVAWAGASGTVEVSEQIDWAPLGLGGVTLMALGLLGSVLVARRAVLLRLARLTPFVAESTEPLQADRGASHGQAGGADDVLVGAVRMARYHRAGCPLASGKTVEPAARAEHEQAGRRPCGVCRP